MRNIQLVPAVTDPGTRGPTRGQFALQMLLRERALPWLIIGGKTIEKDAIPWFWSNGQGQDAMLWHNMRLDFCLGPNVFFGNSQIPCRLPWEKPLLESPHCRAIFTDGPEGTWYPELIRSWQSDESSAKIVSIPYPIIPEPDGPLQLQFDVMIVVKSGAGPRVVAELEHACPNHVTFRYGSFNREQMIYAARSSAVCVYISDDDRMPLAGCEIILSGCPCVGVRRGAPHITEGVTGSYCDSLGVVSILLAVERARQLQRQDVRCAAKKMLDAAKITDSYISALECVRA